MSPAYHRASCTLAAMAQAWFKLVSLAPGRLRLVSNEHCSAHARWVRAIVCSKRSDGMVGLQGWEGRQGRGQPQQEGKGSW